MRVVPIAILAILTAAGGISWTRSQQLKPAPPVKRVGTSPGGVIFGRLLPSFKPAPGNSIVGFSAGCFWGTEEAFREMPGIVATAVGYTGGTSISPNYELAHKTGHAETVLVEFNPRVTPFSKLLETYWTLPRTMETTGPDNAKSPYRAAIWTYDSDELRSALASRTALEKKQGRNFRTRIGPAKPFYLAEEYHQQYDEKTGKDVCPAISKR